MRVLLSIRPFHGHFEPAALLAQAVQDRGDEVLFATSSDAYPLVRGRGFEIAQAGTNPREVIAGDSDYGFDVVTSKARDLLHHIDVWQPDLIVRDPTDIGAVLAGEAAGVPTVTLGFSEFIPPPSWDILTEGTFEAARREFGLAPDPSWDRMHSGGYIDLVPEWFHEEPVLAHKIMPMQPTVPPGPTVPPPPAWLDATLAGSTIGICFGTVYHRNLGLIRTIAEAAHSLHLNVVLLLGPHVDQPDWTRGTPGLWAVPYLPLGRVLPRVDVLVTAGGFNTVMAGLAHGLPMLGIPGSADQPRNTRRLTELGCGLELQRSDVDAQSVTAALARLLSDGAFRIHATRFQELMAAITAPASVAEHLAAEYGPQPINSRA